MAEPAAPAGVAGRSVVGDGPQDWASLLSRWEAEQDRLAAVLTGPGGSGTIGLDLFLVEPWTPPDVAGPVPTALVGRAAAVLARAVGLEELLAARLSETGDQLASARRAAGVARVVQPRSPQYLDRTA